MDARVKPAHDESLLVESTLVRRHRGGAFHFGEAGLFRPLHPLRPAPLRLADPLARHADLPARPPARVGTTDDPPPLEDAAPAVVDPAERGPQRLAPFAHPPPPGEPRFLAGVAVAQPVLPLAGVAVLADRRVQRHVAA